MLTPVVYYAFGKALIKAKATELPHTHGLEQVLPARLFPPGL